jgi:transcriptional regulator with XRE-family HTH domain
MNIKNKRINELLKILNINQKEFCEKTGIKQSRMSQIMSGKIKPGIDVLELINKTFDVRLRWLLGGEYPIFKSDLEEKGIVSDEVVYLSDNKEFNLDGIEELIPFLESYKKIKQNMEKKIKSGDDITQILKHLSKREREMLIFLTNINKSGQK